MTIIHLLDNGIAATQVYAFLLESLGYEVSCWEQGEKFLTETNLRQVGALLLDMRTPVLDGHAAHEIMCQRASTLVMIFLAGYGDMPVAVEQTRCGVIDSLQKPASVMPLQAALEYALQVPAVVSSRQETICRYQQLTPKERELAHLVAKGLMNREIADAMNTVAHTVEVHQVWVMEKIQAGSLAGLAN